MKKIILTRNEVYLKEKVTYEKYCIPPLILMENAGREVAIEAKRVLQRYRWRKIVVCSGPGNNGGDGMVAARYLYCWGYPVECIILFDPSNLKEPAFTNYQILVKMNLVSFFKNRAWFEEKIVSSDIIIDAIFGIGLQRNVEGNAKIAIEAINASSKFVISVDIPSGLDADTGSVYSIAVKANETITFGFGKAGLYTQTGKQYAGRIKIVDIGYPPELYS
jgi:NAD(P)H-hydrate epimerase